MDFRAGGGFIWLWPGEPGRLLRGLADALALVPLVSADAAGRANFPEEAKAPPPRPATAGELLPAEPGDGADAVGKAVRTSFDRALSKVLAASEGTRNRTLYNAAYTLGTRVASGHLTEAEVRSALGRATALGAEEAKRTIDSGLAQSASSPWNPSKLTAVQRAVASRHIKAGALLRPMTYSFGQPTAPWADATAPRKPVRFGPAPRPPAFCRSCGANPPGSKAPDGEALGLTARRCPECGSPSPSWTAPVAASAAPAPTPPNVEALLARLRAADPSRWAGWTVRGAPSTC